MLAQSPPDAGRILQEEFSRPPAAPLPGAPLQLTPPASPQIAPGGPTVTPGSISFKGNTVFSSEELAKVAGNVRGKSLDLAQLRALADRVTKHYQDAGYPFARALLPQQSLSQGGSVLLIVVEGRYGQTTTSGLADLAEPASTYLSPLRSGDLIRTGPLERVTLLLDDLPGITTTPVIKPGILPGTADLDIAVERKQAYQAELGLDNHGNYYSGQWRSRASLDINSPFTLGDQLSLRAVYTESDLWLGSVSYSLPVNGTGLRAGVAYAQTAYSLENGFEGNEGIARIGSVNLAYPLLRSQRSNLNLGVSWQHKRLYNSYFYGAATERYHSSTLPLSLAFDHRDSLMGGGVTYGALAWTHGNLHKNDPVRRGAFNKLNLDIARLQSLGGDLSLFARYSAQWADKNLDSSESMAIGGPGAVRAYPVGEASGDQGWFAQLELRWRIDNVTPYAFYDYGRMKINAKPQRVTQPAPDQTRSGAGLGLRFQNKTVVVDATVAWRTQGGPPTSDTHADPKPRFWLSLAYSF